MPADARPAIPPDDRHAAVMRPCRERKVALETGGVPWSWVRAPGTPQHTGGDRTTPFPSPSWDERGRTVPTGDTGLWPPSASSWHRGTERAVDRPHAVRP